MEAEEERAAEAQREKEAGNDAYRKQYLETAVDHYTRGAALDRGLDSSWRPFTDGCGLTKLARENAWVGD